MEVLNAKSVTMTNFEVMTFLQEQKEIMKDQKGKKKEKKKKINKSLLTVTLETLSWMENSPSSVQTSDDIQNFCQALAEYCAGNKNNEGLTLRWERGEIYHFDWENFHSSLGKHEVVQLINHRPASAVEIQLLLERSEERLSESQVYDILEIVHHHLPNHIQEEEEEEEEEADEVEGERDTISWQKHLLSGFFFDENVIIMIRLFILIIYWNKYLKLQNFIKTTFKTWYT